jgi:hypothetical protein
VFDYHQKVTWVNHKADAARIRLSTGGSPMTDDDDEHDLGRPLGYRHIRKRLGQLSAVRSSEIDDVCRPHRMRTMHRQQTERAGWIGQGVTKMAQDIINFAPPRSASNPFKEETDFGPAPAILAEQIISPRTSVPNLEIDGIY